MGQGFGGFNGGGCFCLCVQGFDRVWALGLAAFGPTMLWVFWVNIRCFGCCGWRFRHYGESLWQTPQKEPKGLAPAFGPRKLGSLRSGVPPGASTSSMSSASPNGAARQSPDEHLHSAFRRGGWIKIKSVVELTLIRFVWGSHARVGRPGNGTWQGVGPPAHGCNVIVPTLRVGMQPGTLRVPIDLPANVVCGWQVDFVRATQLCVG